MLKLIDSYLLQSFLSDKAIVVERFIAIDRTVYPGEILTINHLRSPKILAWTDSDGKEITRCSSINCYMRLCIVNFDCLKNIHDINYDPSMFKHTDTEEALRLYRKRMAREKYVYKNN